ncbi:MAG: histidinol-phosphatase HisJ family protein [Clostridia bacterium]|nr:histidinol-phosphatase HisJ family protein [Clostridia bacterium]
MFNSHTHSKYSHDSEETIDNICKSAINSGLKGIAFTDHVTVYKYDELNIYSKILKCKEEIFAKRKEYEGKLKLLFGVEISESFFNPNHVNEILNIKDLDVVLCSLHGKVPIEDLGANSHLRINDFTKFSKETIKNIVTVYYNVLKNMAKTNDYDVLAHLTYPFRYINCRDKVGFDIFEIKSEFVEILNILIERDKALELNTSMSDSDFFMPSEEILTLYKQLGGKKVTLGSDAHTATNVAKGLKEGIELLKKCGFTKYYYYENRKPVPVKI